MYKVKIIVGESTIFEEGLEIYLNELENAEIVDIKYAVKDTGEGVYKRTEYSALVISK